MYYAPMYCDADLPIICYQMTVMKAVATVNDHSSIEIPTSSENGQHGDNLQLQSENYETNSNKRPAVEEEQRSSVRHINIYMMKSIILFNIVRNKILTILLRSLNISKKI